jgi:hypothetical protein
MSEKEKEILENAANETANDIVDNGNADNNAAQEDVELTVEEKLKKTSMIMR